MKLFGFTICPFVQRVMAVLETKRLDYELEIVPLEDKPSWFLQISPNGQVPVLLTDDGPLFESEAIVEYLEEAHPPSDPVGSAYERARERAWSYLGVNNYIPQCRALRSPDAQTLETRTQQLGAALDKIEAALAGHRFFSGDQLGRVDLSWFPLLHRAAITKRETNFDMIGDRPGVARWQANLLTTDLPSRSVPSDFLSVFSSFYFSERTYLGAGRDVAHTRYADGDTVESILG